MLQYVALSHMAYPWPLEMGRSLYKTWEYILSYLVPANGMFRNVALFKLSSYNPPLSKTYLVACGREPLRMGIRLLETTGMCVESGLG